MEQQSFLLNKRFKIDPVTGTVSDTVLQKQSRLEHRLMNLLLLLCRNQGKLIARDLITKEIWDDYGNADESLTQAISYLRKVLNDEKKTIIETIPKKGYIFHGVIENEGESSTETEIPKRRAAMKRTLTIGIILLVLVGTYFIFRSVQRSYSPDVVPNETIEKSNDTILQSKGADVVR